MRIGFFGGTIDPPHNGHLRLAHAAREQLRLDRVLWAPAGDPPHKRQQTLSPMEDRVALVEAAIAGEPAFQLSRVDVDRPGPHFSADTVILLRQQFPNDELIFLMGGDSLQDLPTWGRPEVILAHCTLGVLRRPGAVFDLDLLERALPGAPRKIEFVDVPPIDIASQEIRPRVQSGKSLAGLVPEAVAREIKARGMYRNGDWKARPQRGEVPDYYHEVLYWKLFENKAQWLWINLLGLPMGAAGLIVFGGLMWLLGRDLWDGLSGVAATVGLVVGLVLTLSAHELAHGLAMQAFGARPRYGIKWEAGALYATAPGYAFNRAQYLVVVFAPLVGLSVLATIGITFLPEAASAIIAACAILNTIGACGDVYIGWLVSRYPPEAYVIDEADGMRVFLPVQKS
ncbi:MAG: nicotinate-nucleotide adenylyltransferase [Anaerolineales bacterium]